MKQLQTIYTSPFGTLELVCDSTALTALRFASCVTSGIRITNDNSLPQPIAEAFRWLDIYFAGTNPDFLPPLRPQGTQFQLRVWQQLLTIPYGHTATYGEIARRIGCRSAQAVGQAIGRNPIALIIPCHRIVGSDGSLVGYAYGIELKRSLLKLENVEAYR